MHSTSKQKKREIIAISLFFCLPPYICKEISLEKHTTR